MTEETGGQRSVVVGAVRYALSDAEAWSLRSYAAVGTLVAVFTATLFLLAVPRWVVHTDAGTLQRVGRAFFGLVGLVLVATMLLPLLFVDRRRRAGRPQRQVPFAVAGYGYLLSLYLALVVTAPPEFRSDPGGPLAPVLEALYAVPPAAGVAFPAVGIAAVLGLHVGLDR